MNRLSPVLVNIQEPALINPDIMTKLFFLYLRYSKYLDDDFAADGRSLFGYFIENTERLLPYFWVVFESNTMRPAGFVYLDKISGDSNTLHSAEVSACFFKEFWGGFTYKTGRKFLKICFVFKSACSLNVLTDISLLFGISISSFRFVTFFLIHLR